MRVLQIGSVLAVLTMLCIAGCKKDDPAQDPVGPHDYAGQITMGGTSEMVVHPMDTILNAPPPNGDMNYLIDMDQDGNYDIQFHLRGSASPASYYEATEVWSVNSDVSIRSFTGTDTTFMHADTTGTTINQYYSCARDDSTDVIISTIANSPHAVLFDEGELLSANDEFTTDSLKLYVSPGDSPAGSVDNGYVTYWHSDHSCWTLPLDTVKYIGVKIVQPDGGSRLGWLKLERLWTNQIHLISYAIQQ